MDGIHDDVIYVSCDYDVSNYSTWNTSNASCPDDGDSIFCEAGDQEDAIKTFQVCVFALIFLLGVSGNGLVIATFALYRRLRLRSVTDVFLFHLALADLLLLLTLPLQAADTLGWTPPLGFSRAARACYALNTYSGLLLLACISVDRYLVVARAQEMLHLRRRMLAGGRAAAAAVWLAAALLSLPVVLYSRPAWHDSEAYCGLVKCQQVKMATNGAVIAVFCLSLAVMATCYSLIACVLSEGGGPRRVKQWHRQRTLKLMVGLVLVFLAFQLPYTVVLSRKMAGNVCELMLEYVTCTLAYARCGLNPVLYALVGVRFRSDVARLLRDSGCGRVLRLGPQSLATNSISLSSPAAVPQPRGGLRQQGAASTQISFSENRIILH
ncbi:C-C chemokine receptor type 10 [Pungitius pungitius]|uniref:C-C chemokine receptor type 10 n=1 Tax=Pungitius pungitius TaxID=134920 RepID=UPI002E1225B3